MIMILFFIFFFIGLISFGGGYAMIPLIQTEVVERHQWINMVDFSNLVALAGVSPGPIGLNLAVATGFIYNGLGGVIVAALGMILPSLIVMIIIARMANRLQHNKLWKYALYGVRATVTGFILYSAIIFIKTNHIISSNLYFTLTQLLIFIGSLFALFYFKKHPLYVIIISGLVGITLYS